MFFSDSDGMNIVVAMVIRKNLLHEPRVNRESNGWSHPLGFLRQTAEGKMKVSLSGFLDEVWRTRREKEIAPVP